MNLPTPEMRSLEINKDETFGLVRVLNLNKTPPEEIMTPTPNVNPSIYIPRSLNITEMEISVAE